MAVSLSPLHHGEAAAEISGALLPSRSKCSNDSRTPTENQQMDAMGAKTGVLPSEILLEDGH